jgi:hypothetical protein
LRFAAAPGDALGADGASLVTFRFGKAARRTILRTGGVRIVTTIPAGDGRPAVRDSVGVKLRRSRVPKGTRVSSRG